MSLITLTKDDWRQFVTGSFLPEDQKSSLLNSLQSEEASTDFQETFDTKLADATDRMFKNLETSLHIFDAGATTSDKKYAIAKEALDNQLGNDLQVTLDDEKRNHFRGLK